MLEASADGGALKTERKGVSLYDVRVLGRAAHAGLEPERGVNATVELAHQVLAGRRARPTRRRHDRHADRVRQPAPPPTRCRPTARSRSTSGCGRSPSRTRVDAAMRALRAVLPGAALEVTGGPNRPPLEAAVVGGAVRAGRRARRTARPAGARRRRPSAARRTATSPPGSARPRSTASAPSAAGRTPTTSTCSSRSCPAAPRCSRALVARPAGAAGRTTSPTTGAARP